MKNNSTILLILIFLQSCAQLPSQRDPSQSQLNVKESSCMIDFDKIKLDANQMLSLQDSQVITHRLKQCGDQFSDGKFEARDRFMYFKVHESGVWLKSLYGNLYLLKNNVLTVMTTKFPIASFELKKETINLYSANDSGRFCTFQVLENSQKTRDSSCQKVAEFLSIKGL